MIYAQPGSDNAVVNFKAQYDNFIGGEWVKPTSGEYFDNSSPVNGQVYCQVARSTEADISLALDAAHAARASWAATSVAERSNILLKIADRIEANLEELAVAETWENGKPVRETLAADLPLVVDHFRYFAGCIRAQEGSAAELRFKHRKLSFPRANWRSRSDHSLELPDSNGSLETSTSTGGRLLCGDEACRANTNVYFGYDGKDRRSSACWRGQHR